jgi:hypothetical protein
MGDVDAVVLVAEVAHEQDPAAVRDQLGDRFDIGSCVSRRTFVPSASIT